VHAFASTCWKWTDLAGGAVAERGKGSTMTAELEYHIWKLLEELNKHPCQICMAGHLMNVNGIGQHYEGCDFWDKLKLMREIVHDNGDDRE